MGRNDSGLLILGLLGLGYLMLRKPQNAEIESYKSMMQAQPWWWARPMGQLTAGLPGISPGFNLIGALTGNGKAPPAVSGPIIPKSQDTREEIATYKSMAAAAISRAQGPFTAPSGTYRPMPQSLGVALATMREREPR